jgi:branched-chain amino acid transport system ATP-binding protein
VTFEGLDIIGQRPEALIKKGIAMIPEGARVFARQPVEQNLRLGAYIVRDKTVYRRRLERVYKLFPRLLERREQLAGTMSGGERQMLAIGRALMSRPRLLLLDEPSLGLAPVVTQEIFRTLGRLHAQGLTCLLVEQDAALALATTSRSYVFRTGLVVAEGGSAELRQSPLVEEIYLGGEGTPSC